MTDVVLQVANRAIDKEGLTEWFRSRIVRATPHDAGPALRALLLAVLASVVALPPAAAAEGIPVANELLEAWVRNDQPWAECRDQAKADGLLPDDTPNSAQTCVLAGGDVYCCFPQFEYLRAARGPSPLGIWFILRPRSLWTATAYDLLRGNGG